MPVTATVRNITLASVGLVVQVVMCVLGIGVPVAQATPVTSHVSQPVQMLQTPTSVVATAAVSTAVASGDKQSGVSAANKACKGYTYKRKVPLREHGNGNQRIYGYIREYRKGSWVCAINIASKRTANSPRYRQIAIFKSSSAKKASDSSSNKHAKNRTGAVKMKLGKTKHIRIEARVHSRTVHNGGISYPHKAYNIWYHMA